MSPRRPIRIGNSSGAINDGIDQVYRLARDGNVDAITADYLAEFNIAWKAIELTTNPDLGYEPNFLEQLAWHNGDAARLVAKKGIKVVHDGGALNPRGLARKVNDYFHSLGIRDVKVAWVGGDDVTRVVREGGFGEIEHLDRKGTALEVRGDEILAANVYTGHAGIVTALKAGAQIVICGRCCDASPVTGLATWWHKWGPLDLDAMAGSLMAGHLIECGAYVTGGNYCGFLEIEKPYRSGWPIAEIASDGVTFITKPEGSNGAVTVDTTKAQLLYEIQGPIYLNPDVVAKIDGAQLEQLGKDRVRLSGIKGLTPPPTMKLAVCLLGGWHAELSAYVAGLQCYEKFEMMKSQVLRELDPKDFSTISIEAYGFPKPNPNSQKESTMQIRLFVQTPKKEAIAAFKRAIFYNGMQGYCGLHLGMDWRTVEPKMFVSYFPGLLKQSKVSTSANLLSGTGEAEKTIPVPGKKDTECSSTVPKQESYEPQVSIDQRQQYGRTVTRPLGDLVFARSGDKGGNANVGLWVRDAAAWPWLQTFLTSQKLIEILGDDWDDRYTVERCEFPNLWAVHFVVKGILQHGVSSSSILDGFAKSFGEFIRAREVQMPERFVRVEQERREKAIASAQMARL
ncbi:DUF1446-domain-containing protein [Patellaria atrata CBS 101060]|uniref:DUF1446-domain-containing protein n=1 Tax=Patellaria atrata CBS 101060 TaxID=1346257 RepID=A0A9P4S8X0_9PEZI|nr:DUF1446-domain-containing protein [Patellaria atrata CBS 101060]